ncbi:MAG TPA: hypothetical protein VFT87_05565 [Candidatus Saccharimonadales bacterium]|nr:hypothetical protein [Candidatus Saccharimonadales bacterium]
MTNKPVSLVQLFHAGWKAHEVSLDSRNSKGLRALEDIAIAEAKRHLAEAIEWIISDNDIVEFGDPLKHPSTASQQAFGRDKLRAEQRKRLAEWLGEKV